MLNMGRWIGRVGVAWLFVLLRLVSVLSMSAPEALALPTPTASVVPPSRSVGCGGTFSVDIAIDPSGRGVSGGELNFSFDPSAISVNDVAAGGLLGASPLVGAKQIDNINGTVVCALGRVGMTTPPTPSGVFATITLTAKSVPGTYALDIVSLEACDENFADISGIVISDGSVTVLRPDWNVDMNVNCSLGTAAVTFGVSQAATNGYDAGLDEIAPPPPPEGQEAFFYYSTNNPTEARKLNTSLIPPAPQMIWPLRVNYITLGPAESDVSISWNVADIPSGFAVTLTDLATAAVTDMTATSSYTFHIVLTDLDSSKLRSLEVKAEEIPSVGTINVTSSPSGATFSLNGAASYSGTTPWSSSGGPAGGYTIAWGNLEGYTHPSGETKTLASGGNTTFTGIYVAIPPAGTPPTVITTPATDVSTTSATLNGNLTAVGTASSVAVSFEWGVTGGYGSETTAKSISAIGAFSANLTGLSADTAYHFRAKAAGEGSTVYGDDMIFTTASLADTAAPGISMVTSSNITISECTITWTTNEAGTSQVEYGLTEEYGSSTTVDTNLVNTHSTSLTGLKAKRTYHYRVISKDAADNQAVSGDNTFTTTARSGVMPAWAWVLLGLAVIGLAGAAACLIRGRLAKQ